MSRYNEINRVAKYSMAAVAVITLFSYLFITPKFTNFIYSSRINEMVGVVNHVVSCLDIGNTMSAGRPLSEKLLAELELIA